MRYALVNNERQEAGPSLLGACLGCGHPMIAKCGAIKVPHWAHRSKRVCDSWWENETPWHRNWKAQFPDDWQEVRHKAENGEIHIADVKTDKEWVVEFQHSFLRPDERQSREEFYEKLVWVVDGTRLKRDKSKFSESLNDGIPLSDKLPVVRLRGFWDECALLRDWVGSRAPVFLDFGEESTLWYLLPKSSDGMIYIVKFSRPYFIQLLRAGEQSAKDLNFWFEEVYKLASALSSNQIAQIRKQQSYSLSIFA